MVIDYFLIAIGLIWLIVASINDIKTREVPDWISYSLIIIVLTTKLIQTLVTQQNFILKPVIGLAIFFIIANILYYSKQWGGGDAKLLMGIGALFAIYPTALLKIFNPNLQIPFLLTILINIILIGTAYSILFLIYLVMKNYKISIIQLKKTYNSSKNLNIISLILIILAILITPYTPNKIKIIILTLTLLPAIIIQSLLISKALEIANMIKPIPVRNLTEGDWIIDEKIKEKFKISTYGVTKEQIKKLKTSKIQTVLIKEGFPFVPSMTIAVIISLIYGSWWMVFL